MSVLFSYGSVQIVQSNIIYKYGIVHAYIDGATSIIGKISKIIQHFRRLRP